ncbi:exodeoxyribonuclease VII large subunit [Chthonobacter rhizosphaerae]|uniref:exodeoxyribonuclease VII large subunit n=1 Tax=Chthonobacter rhizosphaerae TaxID=2735553 RepID=UPI0015EE3C6F|nr:exodeoxyribonuclease VII large subunit [Chthonobacter rhizosphaerae]
MSDTLPNVAEYTVSEISFALKRTVEEQFGHVRVRGEISGYRGPHSSGHAYFALKDDAARLEAVVWRTAFSRLRFKPEEGMEVIATGKLTTFPGSSKYQIVIESLEPAGIGALMALLDERKRKLAAEGLFDPARKRPLPFLPKVVGVVTSPTGAVIRDILHRIADRFPVHVLVWPVRVQGETCGAEVAAGIRGFNALPEHGAIPRPDVIIVARGGGSLEDLWGFNDEVVVRAAAESGIPLVSAVGHETDWTLIDHAADVRAPTPTGAAEMAVPVRRDLLDRTDDLTRRLRGAMDRSIEARRTALLAAARALPRPRDVLALPRQRFDTAAAALASALRANTALHHRRFERVAARLSVGVLDRGGALCRERLGVAARQVDRAFCVSVEAHRARFRNTVSVFDAVNHRATLKRGFALIRDEDDRPVFETGKVAPGARLSIEFCDGRVGVTADGEAGSTPPEPTRAPPPRKARQKADPEPVAAKQGSLF